MKKYLLLAVSAILTLGAAAQNYVTITTANGERHSYLIDEVKNITLTNGDQTLKAKVLTFEDGVSTPTDINGNEVKWSDLIDDAENFGTQLYNQLYYAWWDPMTDLYMQTGEENYGMSAFYGGGIAISNYTSTTLEGIDYMRQLSAYTPEGGNGGHNGSANFGVVYGSYDGSMYGVDNRATIEFATAPATISHCYINLGAYGISTARLGNAYCPAATADSKVEVVAEGYDADGKKIGEVSIAVVDGTNVMTEWTRFNLYSLGEVSSVKFNVVDRNGDLSGAYGLNFPGYFLIDDIAVIPAE